MPGTPHTPAVDRPHVYTNPRRDLVKSVSVASEGQLGTLVYMPQTPFRCEQLWPILTNGRDWWVHSVKVGLQEQLMGACALSEIACVPLYLPTVQVGVEVRIVVERRGRDDTLRLLLAGSYL